MSDHTQGTPMAGIPPSVLMKQAFRKALRSHPQGMRGAQVSAMSLDQLRDALIALGVDTDATLAAYAARVAGSTADYRNALQGGDQADSDQDQADSVPAPDAPDPVDQKLSELMGVVANGGFKALDQELRALIIEARKPPVEIVREVQIPVPMVAGGNVVPMVAPKTTAPTVVQAQPTTHDETWAKLFDVKGDLGKRTTRLWDGAHPNTPKGNKLYHFPPVQTAIALTQIAKGRPVFLYGPMGSGKTTWAEEMAHRTGRPFTLISCDNATDAPTLVGMTVPAPGGGTVWQDGILTRAIQTPGNVICVDEPSVARPGALFVFQNILAARYVFIAETGQRVDVAKGVVFIATDNTNGTGGGARHGYTDTNRLNAAFMDRWGVRVRFDYLPADDEAKTVVAYTRCTRELADLLVSAANVTRAAAENQQLTAGISLRRLFSWAELLSDGIEPEAAFEAAVLNSVPEQDRETLRQQCMLAYDRTKVAQCLNPTANVGAPDPLDVPDPSVGNPTQAGRDAARQFGNV